MGLAEEHHGRGESPTRRQLSLVIAGALVDPVFQPIVDVHKAQIAGFESLTRPRAGSGFPDAGSLFDAAESTSMLWPLEQVTRKAAFDAAAGWQSGILLFMNCSPRVFADARFAEEVQAAVLATRGLTPGRIVLEITERSEQEHIEGLSRQVALLKERGFQIAIDDVGAGTSGLNRIMRLRPHWLKLDRDLIQSIDRDRVKQNLIRFLVHFARLSGVKVIAEGVERPEELAVLMDLGIIHAQGYYLGRPGSRDQTLSTDVVSWLRQRWTEVQSCRLSRPLGQQIGRLIRPACTVQSGMPVADVGTQLRADDTMPGAIVVDGARCVGWADRDWTLERASSEQAGYPIGAILPTGAIVASPEDSVTEIVDQISARDSRSASHPVIVTDQGHILGIVTIADILSTISEITRHPLVRTTPITGMPGRVRADEHLATLISQAPVTPPQRRHDAAIIDIRHFADYNGAYGYELGDQLLQELSTAIRAEFFKADEHTFVAHLSDDRFLVSARAGILSGCIRKVVDRFEQAAVALSATPLSISDEHHDLDGVGLRVILIPDAASHITEPRDLFRLAARIREHATEQADRGQPVGNHSQILSSRLAPIAARLSA